MQQVRGDPTWFDVLSQVHFSRNLSCSTVFAQKVEDAEGAQIGQMHQNLESFSCLVGPHTSSSLTELNLCCFPRGNNQCYAVQ